MRFDISMVLAESGVWCCTTCFIHEKILQTRDPVSKREIYSRLPLLYEQLLMKENGQG